VKESLSHPGYCYYFHQSTGVCSWQSPVTATPPPAAAAAAAQPTAEGSGEGDDDSQRQEPKPAVVTSRIGEAADTRDAPAAVPPPPARSSGAGAPASISRKRAGEEGPAAAPPAKRSRLASDRPKQVRILHILKKHKDSRRPSSWRQPTISISKAEARGELEELLGVLREESGDDLRATFEELARTESDCSSAKRGGDLGFFGPKKMQPPFEEASFALEVGELSGLVESSSGVHILLRIG
jgi:NIMA-interacting peptidyl-prolyl cis-trans isomerase 1